MTDTKPKRRQCFVVGPIGAAESDIRTHSDWLLEGIIRPVFEQHFTDFDVVRADKIATPGMIDAQIINRLLDDDLVIADMTALNANAFYEIGIRHMIEKPIVHMFRVDTDIPFDVKPYRAIPFTVKKPTDLSVAQGELRGAVTEAIDPQFKIDNPVTRARGALQLKQTATPEMKIVLDRVDELQNEIDKLNNVSPLVRRMNEIERELHLPLKDQPIIVIQRKENLDFGIAVNITGVHNITLIQLNDKEAMLRFPSTSTAKLGQIVMTRLLEAGYTPKPGF